MILLAGTLILWVAFIIAATLKEKVLDRKDVPKWKRGLALIFGFFFIIGDVAYNFTLASILFWEFADWERKTLTSRLKHILHSGYYVESEWRFKLALAMCKYMIEPWDFGHCALDKLIKGS